MELIFIFSLLMCNAHAQSLAGKGFESFKKKVYPLIQDQCSRCHSDAGPGPNHSSDDTFASYTKVLGYTDFSDLKNSKFILKGTNNHYDGYLKESDKKVTITQEELITAFQKWWDEGENKSFFEGKTVLTEKRIPKLKDDGSFEILWWDLGNIDETLKGAKFSVEIQKFSNSKNGMKGAYRLKNPRITSSTMPVEVKSIYAILNGVGGIPTANFSKISEIVTPQSSKILFEAHQILLQENVTDKIAFAFQTLKISNQASDLTEVQPQKALEDEKPSLPIFDETKYGKSAHFVKINAPAEFDMGTPLDNPSRDRSEIPRRVRLTKPFEIQATPLTQIQWYALTGKDPASHRPPWIECDPGNSMKLPSSEQTICKNHPIENISYCDISDFLKKINSMQREYTYRLPTEAEWEYVARSGLPIDYMFPWGNDNDLSFAWTINDSDRHTHEVATKKPTSSPDGNDFLYDIFGNVISLTELSFAASSAWDTGKVHVDPHVSDENQILMKGSAYSDVLFRVGYRYHLDRSKRYSSVGFRLVRTKR